MQGLAWTMGCLAEVSYLLHIILFLRIAYGHACPSYAHLIYPMFRYRIIHVPTRNRLLLLHFQYIFVLMKENLELKSHYVLILIRMLQGQHVLVSSPK